MSDELNTTYKTEVDENPKDNEDIPPHSEPEPAPLKTEEELFKEPQPVLVEDDLKEDKIEDLKIEVAEDDQNKIEFDSNWNAFGANQEDNNQFEGTSDWANFGTESTNQAAVDFNEDFFNTGTSTNIESNFNLDQFETQGTVVDADADFKVEVGYYL